MSSTSGGQGAPIFGIISEEKPVVVESQDSKHFIMCEHCHKKLIERKSNGLFYFAFGRSGDESDPVMVEMFIHGSMKLRCWRRACRGWNTLNYFPNANFNQNQNLNQSV